MESDLARFYGIDYRDRWRGDLSLRRLYNMLRYLPPESSTALVARDGRAHWSIEAHLLDNLRMAQTGTKDKPAKPHPSRPTGEKRRRDTPERQRKLAAARARARARRRAIEAGEIT